MTGTNSKLLRAAQIYITAVIGSGLLVILHSVLELYSTPVPHQWFVLAALTLLSGSITVKVPSVPATISVSETFVFTAVLLFGAAAGTLIVALDGLIISLWLQRRRKAGIHKTLFNTTAPSLSLWIAAHIFFYLGGAAPLSTQPTEISSLLPALLAFTLVYFLLNSWLIAVAVSLEEPLRPVQIWRENFLWLSLNYFAGASVAVLLVSLNPSVTLSALTIIVPLLVVSYLTYRISMERVQDADNHLIQLNHLYLSTIETLAMAIDAKDQVTHGHVRRVQQLAVFLAKQLGVTSLAVIKAIEAASLLHDMGKLAVPEYILNKPGNLSTGEFERIKHHASIGADILSAIHFPYPVIPIIRHHHESWDGSGYPDGLAGTDIPIGARILAVVDCFDALTSDRPYRRRLSDTDALTILRKRRGSMYDPLVVDTFIRVYRDVVRDEISEESGHVNVTSLLSGISASSASARSVSEFSDSALQQVSETILSYLRQLVPASLYVLYLLDRLSNELVAARSSGNTAHALSGLRIPLGQRLSGWVAAHRHTMVNADPSLDFSNSVPELVGSLRNSISVPILGNNDLIGVLTLYSDSVEGFNGAHRNILEAAAQYASTILKFVNSHEYLSHRDFKDSVTNLPNQEFLERLLLNIRSDSKLSLPQELVLLEVTPTPICSMQQIDAIRIQQMAAAIRTLIGGADILFRCQTAFVIWLAGTTSGDSDFLVRHIERGISKDFPTPGHTLELGVRIASVSVPADGWSLTDLASSAESRYRSLKVRFHSDSHSFTVR